MFRPMRRFKQQLSNEECEEILNNCTSGVLAVIGDNGYPYAVPLSYVYLNKKIYFHCAKEGHKVDAIKNNDKVSFCVVSKNEVVPEELTTYFKSVIIFGKAKKLDGEELRNAAIQLGLKYYNNKDAVNKEVEKAFERMACYEITIEHITGKQAKELMNKH